MASPALAKPLDAAAALRIAAVEDFAPAGELRLVGVGETLGDDPLEVSTTPERAVFVDDAVRERSPILGAFADRR